MGLLVGKHFLDLKVFVNPQTNNHTSKTPQSNRLQTTPKLLGLPFFINWVSRAIMMCNNS
jgi:hypothetical protein